MLVRSMLVTAVALGLLSALPGSATAAPAAELVDRRVFDATPERTESTFRVDGPTAGPLGGAMDVTVRAADGTLPTTFGSCEPAGVEAIVTVDPSRVVTVRTDGEACAHVVDGSLTVNAGFGKRDVTFETDGRSRPRLVGDGLVAVAHSQLGGQASFSAAVRW